MKNIYVMTPPEPEDYQAVEAKYGRLPDNASGSDLVLHDLRVQAAKITRIVPCQARKPTSR